MHHVHFNSIHSTQLFLKDNLIELTSHDSNVLISAEEQTSGIGRRGNYWDTYQSSLALSFTLEPNQIPTLTPIEVGCIICQFLEEVYQQKIQLKWPNDLLDKNGKKCGGIISQYIHQNLVIVGVGLNGTFSNNSISIPDHYKHGLGQIQFPANTPHYQKANSFDIYQFILKNRISNPEALNETFNKYCAHIDASVQITEDDQTIIGVFAGIGANGEAIVRVNNENKSFLSSSLKIL
jgi:BirA family biotin operon repressor/biotin-[acetyl-CoA-carboxylase] ligase